MRKESTLVRAAEIRAEMNLAMMAGVSTTRAIVMVEIWLRGNGAIAFKIITRELEVGLRAKVVTTEVRDEIIDADFVVSFKNDFHMMLASGFAKFFWLDVR